MAKRLSGVLLLAVVAACSSTTEGPSASDDEAPPAANRGSGDVAPNATAGSRGTGSAAQGSAGYVHNLAVSRFRIGQNPAIEVNAPNLVRWRGSLGAFALDPTNGWTMAVLDNTTAIGPYVLDQAAHEEKVRSYFVSAGVPADEIASVKTNFMFSGSGGEGKPSTPPQLESLASVLTRQVSGIPVPESYAWAKMTTEGTVDMESVYWPPVDAATVTEAVGFAEEIKRPSVHAALLSNLPGPVHSEGGVVIHVTHWSVHAKPSAVVTYDAIVDAWPQAPMRHFTADGTEFHLPHERRAQ